MVEQLLMVACEDAMEMLSSSLTVVLRVYFAAIRRTPSSPAVVMIARNKAGSELGGFIESS